MKLTNQQIENLKIIANAWGFKPTLLGVIEYLHEWMVLQGHAPVAGGKVQCHTK
jgi:hypothetical protein